MTPPLELATSTTLLFRLRDVSDTAAWEDFVARYSPKIFQWCCRNSLQESDAADVTQQVLLKLVTQMRSFEYDRSRGTFRAWLKTVTTNAVRDLGRRWQHQNVRGSGDTVTGEQLKSLADPQALANLTAGIEAQYQQELLKEAEARVQPRVQPHTWLAWQRTAVDQVAASDVAAEVDMTVAEVYVAKSRVNKMLRQEIRQMEAASDGS
ncbi:MAG: sigma-70 family RNA polymerase sigma factor [Planctomycetaceae bacterium]|nr:sigma-70 family RNA polymerase sigma factor [Planctomycetaceae bacterium]